MTVSGKLIYVSAFLITKLAAPKRPRNSEIQGKSPAAGRDKRGRTGTGDLERGTWNVELGSENRDVEYGMERGAWNLDPRTWTVE